MKIAVGVPAYRSLVHSGQLTQMANLAHACARLPNVELTNILTVSSCFVDYARNALLYEAIRSGSDWLLMTDSDVHHSSGVQIVRMLAEGEARGAAMIGPYVRCRGAGKINVQRREGDAHVPVQPEELRGKVSEVDRLGTAMAAVNCRWIAATWPKHPWFKFEHLEDDVPRFRGEDYSFCDGVRARGGVILCDGRFEPVHED